MTILPGASTGEETSFPVLNTEVERAEGVDLQGAVGENNDNDDDDDDDDDITIIMLDQNVVNESRSRQEDAFAWIDSTAPEMEERRRSVLVRELRRVQRASFLHFVLLCLIPTALLIIVIATVAGEDEVCESDATFCELEPRTFMNAFTTRCVCDAIPIDRED
eukprot:scaffold1878_cov170-Amphora_coffeaeformis.AAC.19